MRHSMIRWWLLGLLCVAGAAGTAVADERKEVAVEGAHLLFGDLTQIGAVSLFSRDGEHDFEIDGDDPALDRIDGRNHDLAGDLVGSGDRPGIATDVSDSDIDMQDTAVTGSVSVQGAAASFDVNQYVDFLRARADLILTENTTYNGGSIGSSTDYQIVVAENVQLFLDSGFTGYGVLVLYDTDPGQGQAQLRMTDQAKWYGVILCYSGDTPGDSDKIRMLFGDQLGGGGGVAAGDGVQVLGAVVAVGQEVEVEFPNSAVGDLLYSSAAIANVDAMLLAKPYRWERWRETE